MAGVGAQGDLFDNMADTVDVPPSGDTQPAPKSTNKKPASKKKKKQKPKAEPKNAAKRSPRPFPTATFEDTIVLAQAILDLGSGAPVKRLTLFDHLDKSPESSASRDLITNSSKYGLTTGGYQADELALTDLGNRCIDPDNNLKDQLRARAEAAITNIEAFAFLYNFSVGKKLPSEAVLKDELAKLGIADDIVNEAVERFILNLKFVGLLKVLSGSERVLKVDDATDHVAAGTAPSTIDRPREARGDSTIEIKTEPTEECFIICPIGEEGSPERKHSDVIFGSIVEPILEEFHIKPFRADHIAEPGMITRQVIERLVRAKLVIADLSFNNPNVFYELAIRHALRKPVVQIIRKGDKIPFDTNQGRTVQVELSDAYSAIPALRIAIAEISNNVRSALSPNAIHDNPISTFFPSLRVVIDGS
jgi:hypothetical protein